MQNNQMAESVYVGILSQNSAPTVSDITLKTKFLMLLFRNQSFCNSETFSLIPIPIVDAMETFFIKLPFILSGLFLIM